VRNVILGDRKESLPLEKDTRIKGKPMFFGTQEKEVDKLFNK
jgi:hypothetical protein